MAQRAWTAKRERQYEHIEEGLVGRGAGADTAEEIAARTVNKERARAARPSNAAARRSTIFPPAAGAASGRVPVQKAGLMTSSGTRPASRA